MYYVYVLKSTIREFLYVGYTENLKRRFDEHNNKENISTKPFAPFKLSYYEAYASKKDAVVRERQLKHKGAAIGHLKSRIRNSLNEL